MIGTIVEPATGTIITDPKNHRNIELEPGQWGHIEPARRAGSDPDTLELSMFIIGSPAFCDRVLVPRCAVDISLEPFSDDWSDL